MTNERDKHGWPVRMLGSVRVCARVLCTKGSLSEPWVKAHLAEVLDPGFVYPPSDEFRINGYCSCECEDMDELESELSLLRAVAELGEDLVRRVIFLQRGNNPIYDDFTDALAAWRAAHPKPEQPKEEQ